MKEFDLEKLEVVYEDNHVIVVVKPQNIPSQADSSQDMDMLTIVKSYIKNKYNKPGEVYVGLVHRLDRPTGGVMVFAKTSKAAQRLSEQIVNGGFDKKYLCVTCGTPREKSAKLVHYLKKNMTQNIVKIAPMMEEGAKRAELDYSVLETVQGFSLVKVKLYTGRSHQIRAQMSAIGNPLFGDVKYGADPRTAKKQLALWACELRFTHPTTQEVMNFIVYPPVEETPWSAFNIARYMNINIENDPYGPANK